MAITTPHTAHTAQATTDREMKDDLDALFDAHWSWVCTVLYRIVGDWDDAEDLALEVFCRLYRRPPRDASRAKSWLRRVTTRVGLNALRARERRRRYETEAGRVHLARQAAADPAQELERSEARRQVRHVLAGMKPRAAQLLVLRHGGLSYAEIAETLDVAPGSVGTLLARAEKDFERRYRASEASDEAP